MKKNNALLVLFILLIGMSSARIEISPPLETYNFGDTIYSTLTINPSKVEGNFEFSLVCDNNSEVLYKISPSESAFSPNQETIINHKIILEKGYIGELQGECYLTAHIGEIVTQTNKFSITRRIIVNANLDKSLYNPGETMILEVTAIKANQEKFTGFVRSQGMFEFEKQVVNGDFMENLATLNNLEAGEYNLNLYFYEEDKLGDILNEANTSLKFSIKQVPYSVPLTLSTLEINPGEKIEIRADIFDQSGIEMEGLVNVELISPKEERSFITISSGNTKKFEFPTNATSGEWRIYSSSEKIIEERRITINKKAILDLNFLESSSILKIRNIGNTNFLDTIQLEIANITTNLSLNIMPGEERKFTLSAPTGEHDVKISAGDTELEKRLLLTGNAISIRETKFRVLDYPFVWMTIIVFVILLGIILFFRFNKKTFSLNRKIKTKIEKMRNMKNDNFGEKILQEGQKNPLNSAESSLVIKGIKEPTTIITLNLKKDQSPFIKERIEEILSEINSKECAIELKEREAIIIFSPRKTRNYKNEYKAIKTALEIKGLIDEHNRKFNEKIDFGIGINSGDIIASLEKEKLKYTGTDNTLILSKKISELSEKEVWISERVKNKLLREVRTEKIEKSGNTYYKVVKISERQDNQERLKDLLKRTHLD